MNNTNTTTKSAARDAGQTAFTHIGFAEHHGKQHIYTGCFEETASGSVDEVVAYLEALEDKIPEDEASLSWEGYNGRWYSGDEARLLISREISALLEGTHSSLNMDNE